MKWGRVRYRTILFGEESFGSINFAILLQESFEPVCVSLRPLPVPSFSYCRSAICITHFYRGYCCDLQMIQIQNVIVV